MPTPKFGTSLVALWWRICLPMQKTQVWSLSWEDPLEKKMAAHSSIFAWEILWSEEPGGLQSWKNLLSDFWQKKSPILCQTISSFLTVEESCWVVQLFFHSTNISWRPTCASKVSFGNPLGTCGLADMLIPESQTPFFAPFSPNEESTLHWTHMECAWQPEPRCLPGEECVCLSCS